MTGYAEWSLRLLRKGVLLSETYQLFSNWDFDRPVKENLERGITDRQSTRGWDAEVFSTIRRRIRRWELVHPLIVLARQGMPLSDWRHCLRLWVGATEDPFHTFALDWLYEERAHGRAAVRAADLAGFVDDVVGRRGSVLPPVTAYGRVRAARDLLKTAGDLGMLQDAGPARSFANISMSDDVLVYHVRLIAELEGGPGKVPGSRLWRLAYMNPEEVHLGLLHLHQYRRLDYQVAGSLVQLTLPVRAASELAAQVA